MMNQFVSAPLDSQKLLFALEIEMNKDEIDSWKGSESLLKQLGFNFKSDSNKIIFESLPSYLDENDSKTCIENVTKVIMGDDADKGELAHEIVLNLIRSTHRIIQFKTNEEIKDFIERLFSHKDHSFCPLGKPIMQTKSLEELTSNF